MPRSIDRLNPTVATGKTFGRRITQGQKTTRHREALKTGGHRKNSKQAQSVVI
ncbi:hypothetical protein [Pseudorhodobacter sp.]|uniref:hypothetical protein n=1 Tax=Pseudorhodobacter sp. TaxID=1934400 RepID=UPI002649544D|nr:hypothetical protein [Pseudorhodobacter sp.]MDN5787651.1 hypothetical protein [Pseudorhodobacter sp.]